MGTTEDQSTLGPWIWKYQYFSSQKKGLGLQDSWSHGRINLIPQSPNSTVITCEMFDTSKHWTDAEKGNFVWQRLRLEQTATNLRIQRTSTKTGLA